MKKAENYKSGFVSPKFFSTIFQIGFASFSINKLQKN